MTKQTSKHVIKERAVWVNGPMDGHIITGDGNIYINKLESTDDAEIALHIYRNVMYYVIDDSLTSSNKNQIFTASNIYIDLDTTNTQGNDKTVGADERNSLPSVLDAVITNRHLVLTGSPASGKSTFVNYLSKSLLLEAVDKHDESGLLAKWPEGERDLIPLHIPLRDFAHYLGHSPPKSISTGMLWDFVHQHLKSRNLDFVLKHLQQQATCGKMLIVFDGLDEIPSTNHRRSAHDIIESFAKEYPKNRFIVTSRIRPYRRLAERKENSWLGQDIFEIAPLSDAKVNDLITGWSQKMTGTGLVQDTNQLLTTLRKSGLYRLTSVPMLLDMVMSFYNQHKTFPQTRGKLYQQATFDLLYRWDEQKENGTTSPSGIHKLLREANLQKSDLQRMLCELAYNSHRQLMFAQQNDDYAADIPEIKLRRKLVDLRIKDEEDEDWNWANHVLDTIKERVGLLVEHGEHQLAFPHRSFQEYMAGIHLARLCDFVQEATNLIGKGKLWWEVVLFAVDDLTDDVQSGLEKLLVLLAELCPVESDDEVDWQKVQMAGRIVCEIGKEKLETYKLGSELFNRVRKRLTQLITNPHLQPKERADVGDILARIGDQRRGVGVHTIGNGIEIPDIILCFVPSGDFCMGSSDDDPDAEKREKPLQSVDLPSYWIGKYLITVEQFNLFKEQFGQGIERVNLFETSNHPVRWVKWGEAEKFCKWLTHFLLKQNQNLLPPGYIIRLPSEAEWEKAVRGGRFIPKQNQLCTFEPKWWDIPSPSTKQNDRTRRVYPHNKTSIQSNQANLNEAGIGSSCAVGIFPDDKTAYGVMDSLGNVSEWTRSAFTRSYALIDQEVKQSKYRVVRGGSYLTNIGSSHCRCTTRFKCDPEPKYPYQDIGFRIVVAREE